MVIAMSERSGMDAPSPAPMAARNSANTARTIAVTAVRPWISISATTGGRPRTRSTDGSAARSGAAEFAIIPLFQLLAVPNIGKLGINGLTGRGPAERHENLI